MRMIHRRNVRKHRRPDPIAVIGRDAHELRAFDQERRVPDIADAHLVALERRKPQRGRFNEGRPRGNHAWTGLRHFGLRRRCRALRGSLHNCCRGTRQHSKNFHCTVGHEFIRIDLAPAEI
jgi:hypothetical protein